jgi:spermidine/putrescine transport system permease protein
MASPTRPGTRLARWLVGMPPLGYLIVFFAVPSLIMVLASFRSPGEFGGLAPLVDETGKLDLNLDSYARFFGEPVFVGVFLKSAWYATITTLACLLLGYPLAMLIAKSAKKHRDLLLLLVILPFWSNFLIRIYAWMIILGPNAALARLVNGALAAFGAEPVPLLFSAFAVLVCLVYVHLPFMVLPLYANLEKHDPALLDAAQDLGANAWQRFWRVTFPLSLPGVFAGSALVFIPALGMFAIPDILGGPDDTMIGNLIKQQFLETRDWPFGSVLSILLTVAALALAGGAAWIARRGSGGARA